MALYACCFLEFYFSLQRMPNALIIIVFWSFMFSLTEYALIYQFRELKFPLISNVVEVAWATRCVPIILSLLWRLGLLRSHRMYRGAA